MNQGLKKLIEAKGPGYERLFSELVKKRGIRAPLERIRKQLASLAEIAKQNGYTLEVHVAESEAADRIREVAPTDVKVVHTPYNGP